MRPSTEKEDKAMAILGLTHDAHGAPVARLPVTIKVAIGKKIEKKNEKSHPARLDHFAFKRRVQNGQEVSWQPAEDITSLFEAMPRAIGIIFTSDDIEDVLKTEPALYGTLGIQCRGKLVQIEDAAGVRFEMQATRRTKREPKGEVWPGKYRHATGPLKGQPIPPCGENCPEFREKKCKYSGDLYFRLEKYPVYGAICRIHTSSPRSIKYLSSGLTQIYEQNGRRLAGVRAILRVSPELTWYRDRDGAPHPTVIHVLSVEAPGPAQQTGATEPILETWAGQPNNGHAVVSNQCVAVETDTERVKEIAEEFYPDSDGSGGEGEEYFAPAGDPDDEGPGRNREQEERIRAFAKELGFTDAKFQMLLGESGANLDALEQRLQRAIREKGDSAKAENETHTVSNREPEASPAKESPKTPKTQPVGTQAAAKQTSLYH
jgi:hypothetical protein